MLKLADVWRRVRARATCQDGFTLVELLVVIMTGMVIVFATFELIDITMNQTSRTMDRVEATQNGRAIMEELVQELNSGCVVGNVSPVQAVTATGISPAVKSDSQDLVFVSGLGSGAKVVQTTTTGGSGVSLFEHVVSYSGGVLKDAAYPSTGGSAPTMSSAGTWTFASTPSIVHVLRNVASVAFKYFSFSNPANSNSNSLDGTPAILTTPLSPQWPATGVTNAALSVARIDIAWQVGPSDGSTDPLRQVTMNDSVVFRLTPPTSSASNSPCA